jgi:general secretion pathway protein D
MVCAWRRMRAASLIALALALGLADASVVRAQESAAPPARIFGVELERAAEVDRLLVLASGETESELIEASPEELILRLENATLDPRAARQLVAGTSAVIRDVRISASDGPPPTVEIRVRREPGMRAQLSRRGAIVALEVARPPEPPRAEANPAATVRLNLRDKPIVELVREVQRITQRAFVWDDRLQGTVTVIIQEPVTPGEALEILHATLLAKGFAAVPTPNGTLLVLPLDEARARAPRVERALDAERAGLITVLTRFRAANAEQLVNLLAPFAGGTLVVVAYAPTNGAILVGPENAIHRWLGLARSLDETSRRELVVIRPRHRTAAELHQLLSEAMRDPLTGRARAELFLDERTNALLVRAEPEALASVRAQVAELDAPPEYEGEVLVIRPRFADPEKLLQQLEALSAARGAGAPSPLSAGALDGARFSVALHPSTRSLLITADAATQRELRDLVDELDTEPPLIALEAQVLEVATTGRLALGVDAFIPSTDPSKPGRTIFGIGVGDPFDRVPDPLDQTFLARYARDPVVIPVIGPGGIPVNVTLPTDIAQLKAAEGELRVRTLMQPRLMTLSGEEHEFSAGLNVPVPTAAAASAQGTAAEGDPLETRVNIERQDVGLRLRVKPVAGEEGGVRIAVDLEVTDVQPSASGSRDDLGPELRHRMLQAHTRVDDGGVVVLGMLLERGSQSAETGAPVLKDVPVLGNLLKQTFDQEGERTLLLTLQARILRSADERLADTIRLRTAHERALARSGSLGADGSAWALLVATRTRRADAEALAASLGEVSGRSARVVAWRWAGAERFDVVLAGFANVRDAAAALPALEALGWLAELVAVPRGEPSD